MVTLHHSNSYRLQSTAQINDLKGKVQELVRTKAAVEAAVRTVLRDNEELTQAVEELTQECAALKKAAAMSSK